MRIPASFPSKIRTVEHFWITLKDGCRLAARMWLPADAETRPVPAVLEYIPYRKRDGTRGRDEPMHGYFAGHGYAAIRVDMRGSGESDGVLQDEYLQLELDDAVEVIDWIARQPWSDGRVGMYGGSYAGFTAWAAAKRRPGALKGIMVGAPAAPGIDVPMEGNIFLNFLYPWPFYTTNNRWLDNATYSDNARWARLNRMSRCSDSIDW